MANNMNKELIIASKAIHVENGPAEKNMASNLHEGLHESQNGQIPMNESKVELIIQPEDPEAVMSKVFNNVVHLAGCLQETFTANKEWTDGSVDDTDEEQDSSINTLENSCYIDSITSTSSSGSGKALLPTISRLEEAFEEELEDRLARQNTMRGLLENPSYVDTLTIGSKEHRRLARACRKALALQREDDAKSSKSLSSLKLEDGGKAGSDGKRTDPAQEELDPDLPKVSQWSFVKNVLLLSIGAMISYTAYISLRNLQSSLNSQNGMGMISLATGYGMFMIGSMVSPFVVKALSPKRAILLALANQIVYVAMNTYPSFYTLLPSTMMVGLCNAFLWIGVSTYLTYMSVDYAKHSGKPLESVMSKFFGLYYMIFQLNNIFGNLLSSLILFSGQSWDTIISAGQGNGTVMDSSMSGMFSGGGSYGVLDTHFRNETMISYHNFSFESLSYSEINDSSSFIFDPKIHCGANHCHSFPIDQANGRKVDDTLRYILMGTFGVFEISGFLIIFFSVTSLKSYKPKVECSAVLREIKSVFGIFTDRRFLLLVPLQFYTGLEMAFLPGDILKAFVTCPVGIEMVGYVMMCYGATTACSSYVAGRLNKICGQLVLICSAGVINLVIFICLFLWETKGGDYLPIMLLVASWGVADGIWNTQVNSCIGTLFVKKLEEAAAGFRFISGFGVMVAYGYATFVCMEVKLIFTGVLCVISVIFYIILDRHLKGQGSKTYKVTKV